MLKPKTDDYILMRCKVGQVFESYAVQNDRLSRKSLPRLFVSRASWTIRSVESKLYNKM
jgi:hypothetical protein